MGITLVYKVKGIIKNLYYLNHFSEDGSFLFLIDLEENFLCINVTIENSEDNTNILQGSLINIWKTKAVFLNFMTKNIESLGLFDIEAKSSIIMINSSFYSITASSNSAGSLFFLSSFSTFYGLNLSIMYISSINEIVNIFHSALKMSSLRIFAINITGETDNQYFFYVRTSNLTLKDCYISNFIRSLVYGTSSNFNFENVSTYNEDNLIDPLEGDFSYSTFELYSSLSLTVNFCSFSFSSGAQWGGVNSKFR